MCSGGIRERLPLATVSFTVFPVIVVQRDGLADFGFQQMAGLSFTPLPRAFPSGLRWMPVEGMSSRSEGEMIAVERRTRILGVIYLRQAHGGR